MAKIAVWDLSVFLKGDLIVKRQVGRSSMPACLKEQPTPCFLVSVFISTDTLYSKTSAGFFTLKYNWL